MPTLNIGTEFSNNPEGRYYTDGDGNGEDFRENYLLPRLNELEEGEKLIIIIDSDVDGYGSSFLTEGFAGIVKYGYMSGDVLLSKISISYTDKDYAFFEKKIIEYIKDANFNSEKYLSSTTI